MNQKKKRLITATLTAVLFITPLFSPEHTEAKSESVHTLTFSNKLKVKTLFYPYRDPANVTGSAAKGMQGIAADEKANVYLTYSTGDKTRYGYIYKYSAKGKLIKKSKKLTIGHGQAISYHKGYLYQIADITGDKVYKLQKIDPSTLSVVRTWKIPSAIHPNVIAMQDAKTAIAVSKAGDGYDINKIHLGTKADATRDWREKVHITGLIGKTPKKEIQGFAISKNRHYLLSNGEYISFNPDGTKIKRVSLNSTREPEGITFTKDGKLVIGFNKLNEVFMEE